MATGLYGPYSQIGLIWANVAARASAAKVKKKNAPVLAMKYGYSGAPTTFSFGPALARHLGVLLMEHQEQVRGDQRQDQAGDHQHVQDVQPRDDVVAGERAAEQEEAR